MDRERGIGGDLGVEDRRQRRFVQGLVAANAVALVALALTLTGEDETAPARTVPVAAAASVPGDAVGEPAAGEPGDGEPGAAAGAEPAPADREPADVPRAEGEGDAEAPAGAAGPAPAPPPAPPPAELPRLDVPLAPPAGFVPVQGETLTRSAGPFDLAVEFDPLHPSYPRARLTELGLQATGTAAWQSPADTLVVSTYEFPDPGAAAAFVDEAAAPWRSEPEVMPHDLRGVPGSQAFHQMGRGDHSQFALVARGDRVWAVGLTGASAADHGMQLVHQTMHQIGV